MEVLMEVYGSVISSTLESEIVWFRDTEWNKSSVVWNLCKEEVIQFINIICVYDSYKLIKTWDSNLFHLRRQRVTDYERWSEN